MKLQLMRSARVISLAYLYRCGLCRKDVTRNLHPSGEFQISCFLGFEAMKRAVSRFVTATLL